MGVLALLLLSAQVISISARLVVLRGKVVTHSYYYDERKLLCVSEDDASGLIWNGNLNWIYPSYAFSDRGGHMEFHTLTRYTRSVLDCEMNAYTPCMTSWNITNWNLTNSLVNPMGPVFDRRWEEFTEFNNFNSYHEYRRIDTLNKTSTMVFSIRGTDNAHILLCDSDQYERDFCYWIIIGGWENTKSVIRRCPNGVPYPDMNPKNNSDCAKEQASYTHRPLSPTEWKTFVLSWNVTSRNLSLYDPDNVIMTFVDPEEIPNSTTNDYQIFLRSRNPLLFRSHLYSFLHTTDAKASLISPRLHLNSPNICIELLAGLCRDCRMEVVLIDASDESMDESLAMIDGSKITAAHPLPSWQSVRISKTVEMNAMDGVQIKLLPRGGEIDRPFWAVADIRLCPPRNTVRYGIIEATQDYYDGNYHWPNVTCQKLLYNDSTIVSSISNPVLGSDFEDLYCEEGKIGPHCMVSCVDHLKIDAHCKGAVICEKSGCTCSPGFIGNDCNSYCEINKYGHDCNQLCGSCKDQKCNYKTGVCISGCDNSQRYNIPPFCKAGIDTPPRPDIDFVNETTARVTLDAKQEYKDISVDYAFIIRKEGQSDEKTVGEFRKIFDNDTVLVGYIDTLEPGTTYWIKCQLYVEITYTHIDGISQNFSTRCSARSEFEVSINESSVTLQAADKLQTQYPCPNNWYDLILRNLDTGSEIFRGTLPKLPYEFLHLTPYTQYKLIIGKRKAILYSQEFRTLEAAPSNVRNLEKTLSSDYKLTLKWDIPAHPNGIIVNYEVVLEVEAFLGCQNLRLSPRKNSTIITSTTLTHITFSDLHPYAHYVVKVSACTSKRGAEEKLDFNTRQTEIPSAILSNLRFENYSLFWDPPIDCTTIRGPIPATRIVIEGVSEAVKNYHDTNQTKYNFLKLGPSYNGIYGGETYRARIYALRDYNEPYDNSLYCQLTFKTPPTPPPPVRNAEIFETDFKTMVASMRWQKPQIPHNGEIEHYLLFECTKKCIPFPKTVSVTDNCELWKDYLCTTIEQRTSYSQKIGIAAANRNVSAPGKLVFLLTLRKEPEPEAPENFNIDILKNGVLRASWPHPWRTGGHLEKFVIRAEILSTNLRLKIARSQNAISEKSQVYEVDISSYSPEYREELHLLASTTYKISIRAVTNTRLYGKAKSSVVTTSLAIAFKGDLTSEVHNDDSTISLHIPQVVNDTKDSLMSVVVKGPQPCEQYRELHPNLRELIAIEDHETAWQAAIFPTEDYAGKKFTVGDNRPYGGAVNCPLKPEESYTIVVIVQTELGSMSGQIMLAKTTSIRIGELQKRHDEAWLIPIMIILLIAVAVVYFYRRRRHGSIKNISLRDEMALEHNNQNLEPKSIVSSSKQVVSSSTPSGKESLSRMSTPEVPLFAIDDNEKLAKTSPVKVKDFEDYVKRAIETGLLDKQYQTFPRGQTKPWDYGKLLQNKLKNRYGNLIAYDESRVVLKKLPDDPYSDYINANYIKGYKKERGYIATQGPKPTTVIDFWRMIWQEEVLIICMLANLIESGKTKCEQYWPDIGKKKKYGDVIVLNAKHDVFADYTVRTLQVTCGDETRKIQHLHYVVWPDHGVPLYTHSVVTYLKKLLATSPGNGPIVVHCSAGVGRTGTIILCDICLRRAAAEGVVDVYAETEAIRSQRANMVDNRQQYLLAHLAIVECLLSFPTALSCNDGLPSKIEEFKKHLTLQQRRLQSTAWQDEALRPPTMQTILSERNIAKNRFPELVSEKVNRVYLKRYPSTDKDSDYISAVYVDGVRVQNQYLAAQLPMPSTFNDFWRMIAEFRVQLIIMLQPPDPEDPTCCPIVPSNEFKPTPYINVVAKASIILEDYTTRELSLIDNSEKPARDQQVTILSLNNWKPGRDQDPPSVMSLVSLWQIAERTPRGEGPVVVLCHDGVTGCGLYLALSFLLERMAVEGECDVCLAIRAIRRSRPDFVRSVEHMEFLYNAAITYLEYFETYANFT